MCGRFTLTLDPAAVQEELGLRVTPTELAQRFNVAPTQPVAVLTDPEDRKIEFFRWGLIPSWAKDPSIGNRLINARAETLAEKPSFRSAFQRRRCLVLSSGFYEWRKSPDGKGPKIPYYIQLANGRPITFAGLWEVWQPNEGEKIATCTIITCPANELVAHLHDRMPVILDPQDRWDWLKKDTDPTELNKMLLPYPADEMTVRPVSMAVNNPANDSPECLQEVQQPSLW